ncbi:Uncharacterized RNA pseudouridine synthase Caur_0901 (RNA pseudouridylate synthase) (RNA-uridine isomerase) [Durusdinium trenchii]|uniref:Uncharacterized RNA pseudouridine synthase Caur_0901 (RNA pseudouridylate synthase) (RNA-uridine isomerase) n=1 Tax=Durusdinium trenchii TaxID=1381693 RepID=A0ABP0MNP9_9DINO
MLARAHSMEELPALVALSWHFAKQASKHCEAIGREAFRRSTELSPKAVSQLSWSLASCRIQDSLLIHDVALSIEFHAARFEARDLATVTWAVATLLVSAKSRSWRKIQLQARKKINCCSTRDLSMMTWAFSKCKQVDKSVFDAAIGLLADMAPQFRPQGLTNLCWAFVTTRFTTGVEETTKEILRRGISEFSPQAISILAWCSATALQSSPLVMRAFPLLEQAGQNRIREFSAQGLSNMSWAFSSATMLSAPFAGKLGEQVLKRVGEFAFQEASNTCWAFAASQRAEATIFIALSNRLQRLLQMSGKETERAELEVRAFAWAFNTASFHDNKLESCIKTRLLRIGQVVDQSMPMQPPLREAGLDRPAGPAILLDLSDRLVVRKPCGWETHKADRPIDFKAAPALSDFLSTYQTSPIFQDKNHQFGMMHRLDVPNSGLVLAARSYAAYYDLILQMNLGKVRRHYIALCHGWLPRSYCEITAPLLWDQANAAPSRICQYGKPARSFLEVLSYLVDGQQGVTYTLVEITIQTGRRHQIRSHLAFMGHPLVGDAKYASAATFQRDLLHRNFLHRFLISFLDNESQPVEVLDALPRDLQHALASLEAKDNESARGMHCWLDQFKKS